jgi:hypothetical protein
VRRQHLSFTKERSPQRNTFARDGMLATSVFSYYHSDDIFQLYGNRHSDIST